MSKDSGGGKNKVAGKTQIGPYLPDELVETLRKSAEDNRRGLSEEVQVALEFYLAHHTEAAANGLIAALKKAGLPTT